MARPQLDTGGETAVEYAVKVIKDRIRSGRFAPGQRLVAQDLVQSIGVSAGPIREAVRKLTGEGVVEVRANRGAIIRELTRRDIVEIFETREAVEGQAARLAARRIDTGDNRALFASTFKVLRAAHKKRDHEAYGIGNQSFHEQMMAMAGNRRIQSLADSLALPIYLLRYHQMLKPDSMDMSMSEHELIYDAVIASDEDKAELLMRRHVRHSGEQILASLAQDGSPRN